jgi:hypothetical protein
MKSGSRNRIMIYGQKDTALIVEFGTAQGEALAISNEGSGFQARMPFGAAASQSKLPTPKACFAS